MGGWHGGLWLSTLNSKTKVTKYGGIAIKIINKTGAPSFEGGIVKADAIDGAVELCPIGNPDPIGIMLNDGVPDGEFMWITRGGPAKVFFVGNTTAGLFARMTKSGDTGAANGKAISEAIPLSPFSVDKHFQEVGHILESRTGAGLALVNTHFN